MVNTCVILASIQKKINDGNGILIGSFLLKNCFFFQIAVNDLKRIIEKCNAIYKVISTLES